MPLVWCSPPWGRNVTLGPARGPAWAHAHGRGPRTRATPRRRCALEQQPALAVPKPLPRPGPRLPPAGTTGSACTRGSWHRVCLGEEAHNRNRGNALWKTTSRQIVMRGILRSLIDHPDAKAMREDYLDMTHPAAKPRLGTIGGARKRPVGVFAGHL